MDFPLFRWLRRRFNLTTDMGEPAAIVDDVQAGIVFSGTNLWVLIFAILVASVGLNVNSTAVVIGAMLISPLMGPIVGIGFGAATVRVGLIRSGLSNLLLAVVISLLVSAAYFRLTPLQDAGTEILGRTEPTTWDVLIALFGGAAGAVALTRREKSNVIPGVAIATALMPPLCTAGYGLALGQWGYMFGALYLFCINSVFIILSTLLVVRLLPLPRHTFTDPDRARRVQWAVWGVALLTAGPSVYLAADIVQRTVFTHQAEQFISEQLDLPNAYVMTQRLDAAAETINVLLAGQRLAPAQLAAIQAKLPTYGLPKGSLTLRQGLGQLDSADARGLRRRVLDDVRNLGKEAFARYDASLIKRLRAMAAAERVSTSLPPDSLLLQEVRLAFPGVRQLGVSPVVQAAADSLRADTTLVVALHVRQPLPPAEQLRLTQWLRLRAGGQHPVQLLLAAEPVEEIN